MNNNYNNNKQAALEIHPTTLQPLSSNMSNNAHMVATRAAQLIVF